MAALAKSIDDRRHLGTGTDDGHGTQQDVHELRKLVEAELAENTTHGGVPGIVVDLVGLTPVRTLERPFDGATTPPHCAELEHAEGLAVETDAVL